MPAYTYSPADRRALHREVVRLVPQLEGFQLIMDAMLTAAIQQAAFKLHHRTPDSAILNTLEKIHEARAELMRALTFWRGWIETGADSWHWIREELQNADPAIPLSLLKIARAHLHWLERPLDESLLDDVTPWFVQLKAQLLKCYDENGRN